MDSKSASAEIVSSLQIILYHIKNVYKLARRLLRKLIAGTSTWLYMLSRLVIYTAILLPGFLDLLRYEHCGWEETLLHIHFITWSLILTNFR
jgi:hypothetical protein